jgi:hypothetical protein
VTRRDGAWGPPTEYSFNEADRAKYGRIFWSVPVCAFRNGLLALLWSDTDGSCRRRGGSATSILPILAIHNWWTMGDGKFTPWRQTPSVRRLAKLAGIDKDSVRAGIRLLARLGLLESGPRVRLASGGVEVPYRLSARLFAQRREPFAQFPASMIYGGAWQALPRSAHRHVYLAIMCLDPVANSAAYVRTVRQRAHRSTDAKEAADIRRAAKGQSLSDIATKTGLSVNSVRDSITQLATPLLGIPLIHQPALGSAHDGTALVRFGRARAPSVLWFSPNPTAHAEFSHLDLASANSGELRRAWARRAALLRPRVVAMLKCQRRAEPPEPAVSAPATLPVVDWRKLVPRPGQPAPVQPMHNSNQQTGSPNRSDANNRAAEAADLSTRSDTDKQSVDT